MSHSGGQRLHVGPGLAVFGSGAGQRLGDRFTRFKNKPLGQVANGQPRLVEAYLAAIGWLQAGDNSQQGGFAAAVRPDQPHPFI